MGEGEGREYNTKIRYHHVHLPLTSKPYVARFLPETLHFDYRFALLRSVARLGSARPAASTTPKSGRAKIKIKINSTDAWGRKLKLHKAAQSCTVEPCRAKLKLHKRCAALSKAVHRQSAND